MYENQTDALETLKQLARSGCQSVIISGPSGCGKSHLAKAYSKMLRCSDIIYVDPKMGDIRDVMYNTESDSAFTVCIENIELGVNAVSQAMLKYVESPKSGVYVVITCRRPHLVPETIRSRCAAVTVKPISKDDLLSYAKSTYPESYSQFVGKPGIWNAVSTIHDIDWLAGLQGRQIEYIESIYGAAVSAASISSILWKIQKFSDGTPIDPEFALRFLMSSAKNPKVKSVFRRCLDDLSLRIPYHAVLANAIMIIKYGGIV